MAEKFQSTPSARRATSCRVRCWSLRLYFNPRPPRGERLRFNFRWSMLAKFQSTPSARRATERIYNELLEIEQFQSTPSARRATLRRRCRVHDGGISIHALREESDSKSSEKIQCFCSIIHTCAQFEKELYKGSGEMQNKSC